MSTYTPNSRHLREVLIFFFHMKKSAAEAHRILSDTYGEAAISQRTCREWFQRFKNGDFVVEGRHGGGREKVFEDAELEALLDRDSCQTQQELAGSLGVSQQAVSKRLRAMGIIQKQGDLNETDTEAKIQETKAKNNKNDRKIKRAKKEITPSSLKRGRVCGESVVPEYVQKKKCASTNRITIKKES